MFTPKEKNEEYLKNKIFVGLVEDNLDERRKGRVKVRVQGVFNDIELDHIPWASPFRNLDGKSFCVPAIGKIVNVVFPQGNLYEPQYIYSENYNINLQDKMDDLTDDEYVNFVALLFDHRTQMYVDDEGIKLDYASNVIKINKTDIDIKLKDNSQLLNLGHPSADQDAVLGTNFFEWFDGFMQTLLTPTTLTGNFGAPILRPALDQKIIEYQSLRPTFVSNNVKINDNGSIRSNNYDDERLDTPAQDDAVNINDEKPLNSDQVSPEAKDKIKDQRKKDLRTSEESKPDPDDKPAPLDEEDVRDEEEKEGESSEYTGETDRLLEIIDGKKTPQNDEYLKETTATTKEDPYGRNTNEKEEKSGEVKKGTDEQRKREEREKSIEEKENTDPYADFWTGRKGRSKSDKYDKNKQDGYGTYSTGGGGSAGSGQSGIPDPSSVEPSQLPTGWTPEKVRSLQKKVVSSMESKNYIIYYDKWKINMVGIRTPINTNVNKFNDLMLIWWFEDDGMGKADLSKSKVKLYRITSVPGTYWRQTGFVNNGKTTCGYLKPIQMVNSHKIGMHQGKYQALTTGTNPAWRCTANSDAILSPQFNETGGGMNIHRSSKNGSSTYVGKWSAGCQVFANITEYNEFLAYCNKASKLGQKRFTYTLLLEQDVL